MSIFSLGLWETDPTAQLIHGPSKHFPDVSQWPCLFNTCSYFRLGGVCFLHWTCPMGPVKMTTEFIYSLLFLGICKLSVAIAHASSQCKDPTVFPLFLLMLHVSLHLKHIHSCRNSRAVCMFPPRGTTDHHQQKCKEKRQRDWHVDKIWLLLSSTPALDENCFTRLLH